MVIEEEETGAVIAENPEEALFMKMVQRSKRDIATVEDELKVQRVVLKAYEDKVEELKKK